MRHLSRVFPFQYLSDQFAPLMKLIIRYFSYEGRFSRLYEYHVRLLMLYKGKSDEHYILHVSQHREDGCISTKEDPYTAAQEYLSLCADQDHSGSVVGTTGHYLGGFHLSRLFHSATTTSQYSS